MLSWERHPLAGLSGHGRRGCRLGGGSAGNPVGDCSRYCEEEERNVRGELVESGKCLKKMHMGTNQYKAILLCISTGRGVRWIIFLKRVIKGRSCISRSTSRHLSSCILAEMPFSMPSSTRAMAAR